MSVRPAPSVSVVIPVYNQGQYLADAIESVLAQDYPELELIVVDDGSTDQTPAVVASYGSRLISLAQPNLGAAVALNRGIRAARGTFVCWLSADDRFLPGKIASQIEDFETHPDLGVSYTGFFVIDAAGRRFGSVRTAPLMHHDPFVSIFWRNPINGSTVMMPRRLFDEIGYFDESLRADVDAEMWLRVAETYPIREISRCLVEYRVHAAALSANARLMEDTVSEVRRRRLRDGSLSRHLTSDGSQGVARTLASVARYHALRGRPDLARELLAASRRTGPAPRDQALAAAAALIASRRRLHSLGLKTVRAGRRRLGLLQIERE